MSGKPWFNAFSRQWVGDKAKQDEYSPPCIRCSGKTTTTMPRVRDSDMNWRPSHHRCETCECEFREDQVEGFTGYGDGFDLA
jgi:hypothetical protein